MGDARKLVQEWLGKSRKILLKSGFQRLRFSPVDKVRIFALIANLQRCQWYDIWTYSVIMLYSFSFLSISNNWNPNFYLTMVNIFCGDLAQFLHSETFRIVEIENFLQPWGRYFVIIMLNSFILEYFRYLNSKHFLNHDYSL